MHGKYYGGNEAIVFGEIVAVFFHGITENSLY